MSELIWGEIMHEDVVGMGTDMHGNGVVGIVEFNVPLGTVKVISETGEWVDMGTDMDGDVVGMGKK